MYKIVFSALLMLCITLKGQIKIDSVINVYNTSKDQFERSRAMNRIIVWFQIDHDSAKYYFKVALKDFRKNNYRFGEAFAYHSYGIACVENAHYEEARKNLDTAISIYATVGNDSMIAKAYIRKAFSYYTQSDYESAIKTYLAAVDHAQKANNPKTEAWAYNLLGLVFYNKPNPDDKSALEYYHKSLDISRRTGDVGAFGMVMLRIGSAYSRSGDDENAVKYLNRAMALGDSLNDMVITKWTLAAYSKYYMERKDYFKSNEIEKRSGALSWLGGDYPGVIISYRNVASNHYNLGNYKAALERIDSALYYSLKHQIYDELDEVYEIKSDIHDRLGQKDEALFYYKRAVKLKDSLFSIKNSNNINELQTRFETKEKEKEIELLNVEKESDRKIRNILIGGISVALILIAGIIFALIKINSARKQLKLQKKEIEEQKLIVDEKQKEILDSISYARRIQSALMTSEKYIQRSIDKLKK